MTKGSDWLLVRIPCEPEVVEFLAYEIAESLGIGVETEDTEVRFYVRRKDAEPLDPEIEGRLGSILEEARLFLGSRTPEAYHVSAFSGSDWAGEWKRHFKPLRVGRRLVIAPTWEPVAPQPQDLVIRIDPGQAFGTGHHETTRLCLRWLEEQAVSKEGLHGGSLFDVGTGTGILAFAGALLGFGRVLGIDPDPQAVESALANRRENPACTGVELRCGTAADVKERFDVVVANIQANLLAAMAGDLVERVASTGRLALSGILLEQADAVRSAYQRQGLHFLEDERAGEWCLLAFKRE